MRRRRRLVPSIRDVVWAEMQRQGLSQSEVCRRCTINRSDFNRWINGRQSLRVDHVEQVMVVLGMRVVGP